MTTSLTTMLHRTGKSFIHTLAIPLLMMACFQEEVIPVNVSFSYEVKNDDYSIPVEISFKNLTTGAENYLWTFEGGDPATSDLKHPGTVVFRDEGTYKVTLEAWNEDDRQSKELTLKLFGTVSAGFETTIVVNNISPVNVEITNNTVGGTAYHWKFPGGTPSSYEGYSAPSVLYTAPGDYLISLIVENGSETDTVEKVVSVLPSLQVDFDILPSFEDEDYEAPLYAFLENKSVSGLTWHWSSPGGQLDKVNTEETSVYFSEPGIYTITLTASNGKETKESSKEIIVKPNTGLRTHANIKLGVNTAHSAIGSFYSTSLRRVVRKSDPDSLGKYIDIAFFGLSANFTYNRFVSPDSVQDYSFNEIVSAQSTHFINSLESCGCSITFSENDFDQMTTDALLKNLDIQSTSGGVQPFDKTLLPRIIFFRTEDGRKGAIKIKEFYADGQQSYILVDIKVQKL